MKMPLILTVWILSAVALNVGGQTITTTLEAGPSLSSTSESPNFGSVTRTLSQSTSTINSSSQSPSSLKQTAPKASVIVSLTPSPTMSVSTILQSVVSTDIQPSSAVQNQASSTNSTWNLSSDAESQVNTLVNNATSTANMSYRDTSVYPSILSSYMNELTESSMPQETATVLYATSVDVSPTIMSSKLSSDPNNATTEILSSSFLGVVVANGTTPHLQMQETSKTPVSSTSEIQTLQTSLASLSATFATSNASRTSARPSSNHTASSEHISTATDNVFIESVYRLANISYTPVSAISLESSIASSISDLVEGSPASSESSTTSLESTLFVTLIVETQDITKLSPSESTLSNEWHQSSDFSYWYTSEPFIVTTPADFIFATESLLSKQTLSTSPEDIGTVKDSFFLNALSTSYLPSQLVTPSVSEIPIKSPKSSTMSSVPSIILSESSLMPSESFPITPKDMTSTFSDVFISSVIPNVASTSVSITSSEDTTILSVSSTETSTITNRSMKYKTFRVVFTFAGDCDVFKVNEVLREEFWKALIDIIKQLIKLRSDVIEPENMLCDPLRTYFRISYASNFTDASIKESFGLLREKVFSSSINVPIIDGMHVLNFTARNMKIHEIDIEGPEVAETGLEVVDIVIIGIASFLFAVLVLMMIILVCRECYVRKRSTTFHLAEIPHVNLKLSDFTLTRIPRPKMFYRENSLRKPEPVPLSKLRHSQNGHSRSSSNGKVNVPVDKIKVRMRDHEGGLVVGITCSDPPGPNNDASSSSSSPKSGDQSKRSLLKGEKNGESDGVTNPSYSTDEEVQGTTKIVIQDDENEQLL